MSKAGAVFEPAGIAIATGSTAQSQPSVAHNGSTYEVVYIRDSGLWGTRVSNAGVVASPAGVVLVSDPSRALNRPSLVSNGTGFLVAFDDTRAAAGDIYASRLNSNGVSLDPAGFLVSANPVSGQSDASIAFDGTNYLIAWQDTRSDAGDIYAARVAPSGRVVGRLSIVVSDGVGAQRFPSVAFDGTNFLVVWSDTRSGAFDIYGARVSKAGAVLDTAGIPISVSAGPQDLPDVAWNGTRYLVVWQDLRNGPDDAYGTRVTAGGIVQNPSGIRISSPTATAERFITVNSNGSAFLVAWGDERNATGPDLYAARVDDAGTVLDPTGRQIAVASGSQTAATIAHDGTNYLLTWTDSRSGGNDIRAARVNNSGTVLDGVTTGIPVSTAAGEQTFPQVSFNGSFFVAWLDRRNGGTDDKIYGARIDTGGSVLDPSGFAISTAAGDHDVPEVSRSSGGDWGVAYGRPTAPGIILRGTGAK